MPSNEIKISPTLIREMNNIMEFSKNELEKNGITISHNSSNDNEIFQTNSDIGPGHKGYYINSLKGFYNIGVGINRLNQKANGISSKLSLSLNAFSIKSNIDVIKQNRKHLGSVGKRYPLFVLGDGGQSEILIQKTLDMLNNVISAKGDNASELEEQIPGWLESAITTVSSW